MVRKASRKSKNGERFRKITNVFKKVNEQEKLKSEARKAEKKNKPRGYRARKLGIFTFWFIFILMALIFFVNTFSSNKTVETSEVSIEVNKASSAEAIEFSKDFLSKYFSWSDISPYNKEALELREGLLSRYLKGDLVDTALKTSSQIWNADLKRESILLKEVEELTENKAVLTFKISPVYVKTKNAIEEELKTIEEAEIVKQVRNTKFVEVKLYYDKVTGNYVVYELPSFVYVDELDNKTDFISMLANLKKDDSQNGEIKRFLETFFDSFANDPIEKLSYLFENPESISGLNKTMEYTKFDHMTVYKGQMDTEKLVSANVTLKDPDTGISFVAPYTLVLKQTEQGYLVKDVDIEEYIQAINQNGMENKTES